MSIIIAAGKVGNETIYEEPLTQPSRMIKNKGVHDSSISHVDLCSRNYANL